MVLIEKHHWYIWRCRQSVTYTLFLLVSDPGLPYLKLEGNVALKTDLSNGKGDVHRCMNFMNFLFYQKLLEHTYFQSVMSCNLYRSGNNEKHLNYCKRNMCRRGKWCTSHFIICGAHLLISNFKNKLVHEEKKCHLKSVNCAARFKLPLLICCISKPCCVPICGFLSHPCTCNV